MLVLTPLSQACQWTWKHRLPLTPFYTMPYSLTEPTGLCAPVPTALWPSLQEGWVHGSAQLLVGDRLYLLKERMSQNWMNESKLNEWTNALRAIFKEISPLIFYNSTFPSLGRPILTTWWIFFWSEELGNVILILSMNKESLRKGKQMRQGQVQKVYLPLLLFLSLALPRCPVWWNIQVTLQFVKLHCKALSDAPEEWRASSFAWQNWHKWSIIWECFLSIVCFHFGRGFFPPHLLSFSVSWEYPYPS